MGVHCGRSSPAGRGVAMTPDLFNLVTLGYLKRYCAGEAAARTEKRIARDLQALGLAVDGRDIRNAVADLAGGGWPVGTSSRGAFVCQSRADWRTAYRNLYSRLRTQGRRCRRFRQTFREVANGQRVFDFAEAEAQLADFEAAPLLAAAAERIERE